MSDNAGNSGGHEMETFDKLPPRLREALREFPISMSSNFPLKMLKSGWSEAELIRKLTDMREQMSEFNPENKRRGIG